MPVRGPGLHRGWRAGPPRSSGDARLQTSKLQNACHLPANVQLLPWLFSNSGRGVKLSVNILAGSIVLSAVGASPPHDGVR